MSIEKALTNYYNIIEKNSLAAREVIKKLDYAEDYFLLTLPLPDQAIKKVETACHHHVGF